MTIYQFCKCTNKIFYKISDINNNLLVDKKLGLPISYFFYIISELKIENMGDYDIVHFKILEKKNINKSDEIFLEDIENVVSKDIILEYKNCERDKPIHKIVIEDEYVFLYN